MTNGPVEPEMSLRLADKFFNAAAPAAEGLSLGIPIGKSQRLVTRSAGRDSLRVMFAFRVFGTAMLAEPAVAEIEKVVGLIQMNGKPGVGCFQPTPGHEASVLLFSNNSAPRVRSLSQPHWNGHPFAISYDSDLDGIANLMLIQQSEQIICVSDFRAVD